MSHDIKSLIVHIAGPKDYDYTGIAEYVKKLSKQQNMEGYNSFFIRAADLNLLNWGIDLKDVDELEDNKVLEYQQRNEEALIHFIDKKGYSIDNVIIHTHIALPYCGCVLSPKFLSKTQHVCTVHILKGSDHQAYTQLFKYISSAKGIIIASEFEEILHKNYTFSDKNISIIEIPPSIFPKKPYENIKNYEQSFHKRSSRLIQFTMIRDEKGIEKVMEIQKAIQNNHKTKHISTIILGGLQNEMYKEYFLTLLLKVYGDKILNKEFLLKNKLIFEPKNYNLRELIKFSEKLESLYIKKILEKNINIKFVINATDEQIQKYLETSKYAILPFDKGATMYRTTLLSSVYCKNVVITTRGELTENKLLNSGLIFADGDKLLKKISLFEKNPFYCKKHIEKNIQKIPYIDFKKISKETIKAYAQTINSSK